MHFQKALEIRSQLAEQNPDTYLQDLADSTYELALLEYSQQSWTEARRHYEEAFKIYDRLALQNADRYQPYVARVLNSLGMFNVSQNPPDLDGARLHYMEALAIRRRLAQKDADGRNTAQFGDRGYDTEPVGRRLRAHRGSDGEVPTARNPES